MADLNDIPPDTLQFIDEHLHSVEQLEVLLLLQHESGRWWSALEVVNTLRTSATSIQQRLEDLTDRGLAETKVDAGFTLYRLGVLGDARARTIRTLAGLYRDRRVAVIDRIFCKPKSNLIGFANAFRIKKEPSP